MMQPSPSKTRRLAKGWPGKSRPDWHPALWHLLDVGAVAQVLLRHQPVLGGGGDAALAALVSLHDLGKVSASFRAMLQQSRPQIWRHWEHSGDHLWRLDGILAEQLGATEETRRLLVEAVTGHHGGPRAALTAGKLAQQRVEIGAEAIAGADYIVPLLLSLFPEATLEGLTLSEAKALSCHLNGLTVQADWIGSNPDWFPPAPPDIPLSEYWPRTQKQAEDAVKVAGPFASKPRKTLI